MQEREKFRGEEHGHKPRERLHPAGSLTHRIKRAPYIAMCLFHISLMSMLPLQAFHRVLLVELTPRMSRLSTTSRYQRHGLGLRGLSLPATRSKPIVQRYTKNGTGCRQLVEVVITVVPLSNLKYRLRTKRHGTATILTSADACSRYSLD
jgi:hypothetical protein